MRVFTVIGVLSALCAFQGAAWAAPDSTYVVDVLGTEVSPGMFAVREDVVTPHTAWARPWAQPEPSILFIVPRWGAREIVELAQRMSMKYDVVMVGAQKEYTSAKDDNAGLGYAGERPAQLTQRLTDALAKPHGVIVVGNVMLSILPAEIVKNIEAQVRAGTSLFVTGNDKDEAFAKLKAAATSQAPDPRLAVAAPLALLPQFAGQAAPAPFAAWKLDKGLILAATYKVGDGNMSVSPELSIAQAMQCPVAYDYGQAMVVRALLLAANALPAADRLTTVTVTPGQTASSPVSIRVTADAGKGQRRLRVRVRDMMDRQQKPITQPLAAAETMVNLASDAMPVGQYMADVWLLSDRNEVLDWSTTPFMVSDAQGIGILTPASASVEAGQPMKLTLKLSKPLAADEKVTVESRDFYRRVLSRQTLGEAGQTELTCSASTAGSMSLTQTAAAQLTRAGKLVDEKIAYFPLVSPPSRQGPGWDDFSFMVWSFTDSALQDPMFTKLRDAGMDRLMTGSWAPPAEHVRQADLVAHRYNCLAFPYAAWIGHIYQCNPDPIRKHMGEVAAGLKPYSTDTFSMGDEDQLGHGKPPEFTEQPLNDPWINGSLQAFLRKEYPSLDALNAQWNTTFAKWEDVVGITLDDARKNKQEARWVDHRRHRESMFAAAFEAGRDAVRATMPHARVGFEGAFQTDSFRGYDWAKLMPFLSLMGNYWFTPVEWDIIGSLKSPDTYWGFWNGGYPGVCAPSIQRWISWRCLFHGMNSTWFWVTYWPVSFESPHGIYNPDLTVNATFAPFLDAVREIKAGPGKLLLGAQRQHAPIAIHYSQSSVHANTLDNGGFVAMGAGLPSRIHASWLSFDWCFKEVGLQPRFLPYNQIETDGMKDNKILILPFSQALSEAECKHMRAFVEAGGVLVADVRPGLRDQHGKLQTRGLLDDLFGIERINADKPAAPADLKLDLSLGDRHLQGVLPLAQPDPAVRATTGKALASAGDIPLFIHRTVGKGQTLLLNFTGNYANGSYYKDAAPSIHDTADGDLYRQIALAIAALGNVEPTLAAPDLRGIDIVTWNDGDARYFGFTPNDFCDYARVLTMSDVAVKATTKQPGHFYDVREGKYLGQGNSFASTLKAASALIVAQLPYQVDAVTVQGPKEASLGRTATFAIEVKPKQGAAGNHVVRVEVEADGKPQPHFAANLRAQGGKATFTLPLALNEPQGSWKLTVRDAATGVVGQWTFRVK
ncbi:MAG: hypothetical protein IT440_15330 [Phycisphaeraceae bacterium]|nr:hypothetical protein [Phycisphaeraceae bacterium]